MDFVSRFIYIYINAMNYCTSAQLSRQFEEYDSHSNTRLT